MRQQVAPADVFNGNVTIIIGIDEPSETSLERYAINVISLSGDINLEILQAPWRDVG